MQHSSSPQTIEFRGFQTAALVVGVLALAGAAVGALLGASAGAEGFFESYLFAFLFWVSLPLGCLILLFVNHLAGGSWGALIRRPLEAAVSVLPLMALFFIPLLFGLGTLYDWTHAEYLAEHPTVAWKSGYLNIPFFIVRAVIYFALWGYAAYHFVRQSERQDRDAANSDHIGFQLKRESGMWIVVYILTMTFAAVDWAMSLTPTWWSGIYGVILMIGQAIIAISFIITIMVVVAARNRDVDELLTAKRLQDLGNFLMAFTMFWAYVSASQLIILWSNNIVETNTWYVLRLGPEWVGVGSFLLFFGFFAPFVILFSRWVKRKRGALTAVALWAILVQLVNLYYFVIPTFERAGFQITIYDVLLIVGIGGVWLYAFARSLGSRPILPVHDPRLVKGHGHA